MAAKKHSVSDAGQAITQILNFWPLFCMKIDKRYPVLRGFAHWPPPGALPLNPDGTLPLGSRCRLALCAHHGPPPFRKSWIRPWIHHHHLSILTCILDENTLVALYYSEMFILCIDRCLSFLLRNAKTDLSTAVVTVSTPGRGRL